MNDNTGNAAEASPEPAERKKKIHKGPLLFVIFFIVAAVGVSAVFLSVPQKTGEYVEKYDMKFVYIRPGTFTMGSPDDAPEAQKAETPQHRVTITKGFYMQTTEVIQAQWEKVMGENPSHFKEFGGSRPVENVSWRDVRAFIKKLNEQDADHAYRLPTEAEWEYACRAGAQTTYYTGDNEADLDRAGWYVENSDDKTHPVGEKAPNAFGLYDMHGNVREWCADAWRYGYEDAPADGGARTDDASPKRVVRGGAWASPSEDCRAAARSWFVFTYRSPGCGFRLCLISDD